MHRYAIRTGIQENNHLKEHLQKYYNGELYTAKQLKNIEENDEKDAKEFLLRAYMLVGDDIFWDEDEKYYNVIKEMIKIDETDSDIL